MSSLGLDNLEDMQMVYLGNPWQCLLAFSPVNTEFSQCLGVDLRWSYILPSMQL